jgi:hypothetical protein
VPWGCNGCMREVEDCLECDVDERAAALKDGDATGFAPSRGGGASFGEAGKD